MSLRRVVAGDLPVTVDQLKMQVRASEDEDELVALHLAAACEKVATMSGLVLSVETWEVDVRDGVGILCLPLIPAIDLVSVKQGEDALTGFSFEIEGDRGMVTGPWPAGDVTVRFTVGLEEAPAALCQAILMLGAYWFGQREAVSANGAHSPVPFAVEDLVSDHRRGWVRA